MSEASNARWAGGKTEKSNDEADFGDSKCERTRENIVEVVVCAL